MAISESTQFDNRGRTAPPAQHIVRLSQEQYAALEKQALPLVMNTQSTDLLAGQIVGEQRILQILRKGWVV